VKNSPNYNASGHEYLHFDSHSGGKVWIPRYSVANGTNDTLMVDPLIKQGWIDSDRISGFEIDITKNVIYFIPFGVSNKNGRSVLIAYDPEENLKNYKVDTIDISKFNALPTFKSTYKGKWQIISPNTWQETKNTFGYEKSY
jgi:hypothetical protein